MSGNEEKMSVPHLGEQTRAAHFPTYLVKINLGSLHLRRGVSRQITDLLRFISPLLRINVDTSTGGSGTPREDSACMASNEPGPATCITTATINRFEDGTTSHACWTTGSRMLA
jgi:hypothetical protein